MYGKRIADLSTGFITQAVKTEKYYAKRINFKQYSSVVKRFKAVCISKRRGKRAFLFSVLIKLKY
jgi:uncharacterized protein YktA (UPF0223 family)